MNDIRLLETASGSIVDPVEYSDEDLRRTIALLDVWWNELGDSAAVSTRADEQRRRIEAFALSIGADAATLDSVVKRLAELGRARSFFAVRGPADELLRRSLLLIHGATAARRSAGELRTAGNGTVASLNVSAGGVPKHAIESVHIGWRGLDGDRQRTRVHHGRPWQAVCLWGTEPLAALVADGHALVPGAAGENVTMSGFDWAHLVPGVRLRLGEALLEVSLAAVPCSNLTSLFTDGNFERIHPSARPRNARMYASVIEPGDVGTGDDITFVV